MQLMIAQNIRAVPELLQSARGEGFENIFARKGLLPRQLALRSREVNPAHQPIHGVRPEIDIADAIVREWWRRNERLDRSGLLVVVVPVLIAFLSGGFLSLGFEYVLERLEKLRTRRTLERYVSKNLVKEVLENPESFLSVHKSFAVFSAGLDQL